MKNRSFSRAQLAEVLRPMIHEPPVVRFVIEATNEQLGEMGLTFFANVCGFTDEQLVEFNMASFDDCPVTWPNGRLHIAGREVVGIHDLGRHRANGKSGIVVYLAEEEVKDG